MTSKFLCFYQFVLVWFLQFQNGKATCPNKCNCIRKSVSCNLTHLHNLPPVIPPATITLRLSDNSLSSIKNNSFQSLKHLLTLDLRRNSISSIELNSFKGLTELTHLDLSSNHLQNLNYFLIRDLSKLQVANFSNNYITAITQHELDNLFNLQVLDLTKNHISRIHQHAFTKLTKLNGLYVAHNALTAALRGWFSASTLKNVSLSNNQWTCDCRMKNYFKWFHSDEFSQSHIRASFNIFCRNKKKSIKTIPADTFSSCNNSCGTSSCLTDDELSNLSPLQPTYRRAHNKTSTKMTDLKPYNLTYILAWQGENPVLSCRHLTHVHWEYNGEKVMTGHTSYFISKIGTLKIKNATASKHNGRYCCRAPPQTEECFELFIKTPPPKTFSGVAVALIVVGLLVLLVTVFFLVTKKIQEIRKEKYGLLNQPNIFEAVHDDTKPQVTYESTKEEVREEQV